jgi:hypothetical protein
MQTATWGAFQRALEPSISDGNEREETQRSTTQDTYRAPRLV